jgi:ankyrin repeat protein
MQSRDKDNDKGLLRAAVTNDFHLLVAMLEAEADVNARDVYGNTALMLASERGYIRMLELLLNQPGIDVNAINQMGKTALMNASAGGRTVLVRLLLAHKNINRHQVNQEKKTALVLAYENEHIDIVNLFLAQKETYVTVSVRPGVGSNPDIILESTDSTAWTMAVEAGYLDIVRLFLAQNHPDIIDQRTRDRIIHAGLKAASKGGHVEIANLFLDEKEETNIYRGSLDHSFEAWMSAIHYNQIGIVKLFLQHKKVLVYPEVLHHGLMDSLRLRDASLAHLLLTLPGLNIHAEGVAGMTPLMEASAQGHQTIVELLLTREGLEQGQADRFGMTALKYAITAKRFEVVHLLINHGHRTSFSLNDHLLFAVKNADANILHAMTLRGGFDFFDPFAIDATVLEAASFREDSMDFFVFFFRQFVAFVKDAKVRNYDITKRLDSYYLNSNSGFPEVIWRAIKRMAMVGQFAMVEEVLTLVADFFNALNVNLSQRRSAENDTWPYLLQWFSVLPMQPDVTEAMREPMRHHSALAHRFIVDQLIAMQKVDNAAYRKKQQQAAPSAAPHRFFQAAVGEVKPDSVLSTKPSERDVAQEAPKAKEEGRGRGQGQERGRGRGRGQGRGRGGRQ